MPGQNHITPNPPAETAAPMRVEDLSILDRSAFNLAFQEEIDAADPEEPVTEAFRRATLRVERFLARRLPARS